MGIVTRVAVAVAALMIVLLAAVTAVCFFAYAVYLLISEVLPGPSAAALTGIVVLLGAVLIAAVMAAAVRPRGRRKAPAVEGYESAAEAGNFLGRRLRGLLDAHSLGGLVAMGLAGFAVGFSPQLRKILRELLKW